MTVKLEKTGRWGSMVPRVKNRKQLGGTDGLFGFARRSVALTPFGEP